MRPGKRGLVAGAAALALSTMAATTLVGAAGSERTISLFNIHTKETVTTVYKRDGRYVPEGLEKVNHVMRDWRRNEATKMDPELVDLIWEMHAELGSKEPVHIISGYRSRATNDMLRRSSGGQASESRHMLGKAADVHFPDVPVKALRWSAMIRERGGVGYYPTSAIPFVHVDTDRVRAWPRMPRHELALLFPAGQTRHSPADGGALGKDDVRLAQVRHRDLAEELAKFHADRRSPRPATLVAEAPAATWPAPEKARQMAAVAPPAVEPRLVQPPRAAIRPTAAAIGETRIEAARFVPPSTGDRDKLTQLAALATGPQLLVGPLPARRARMPEAIGVAGPVPPNAAPDAETGGTAVAALAPATPPTPIPAPLAGVVDREGTGGWIPSPAWDDEHPEELSYRPFPILPLLTETADEPLMADLVHPDVARTLDLVDQPAGMATLRFRPGEQMARMMWSQQFTGDAIGLAKLEAAKAAAPRPGRLETRPVRTSQR